MTAPVLDVIAIGRSSVDLYGQQIGGRLEDMATFVKAVGGCPSNIAIGTARLGLRSGVITRVGDEAMGRFIREQMQREGVDVRGIRTDPARLTALVVLGVRDDGQKVLLAIKSMGGESTEAWRAVLDDLIGRGLRRPEFLIVDGAPGLEKAIAAVWDGVPVQRCTVHKHRNLLAHAPERLHEEITADYNDMIYAATREEVETRRKAFIRKWRLKHRAVADSLQEAGERLFSFTRLPPSQWRSVRTTNAIERLHEEFKRRIKTQTVLPSADTAAMLFWALLASGQINMRKVDGWQTLATKPIDQPIDQPVDLPA
jgi:transposase-like protein